jgi:Protein of unknown function (DUF3606)
MPDDKKKTGSPDRDRINVNEDYELRDWSKRLGVTPRTNSRKPSRRWGRRPQP